MAVCAALFQQCAMRTLCNDFSGVEYEDKVSILNRGEAVRNDERGAVFVQDGELLFASEAPDFPQPHGVLGAFTGVDGGQEQDGERDDGNERCNQRFAGTATAAIAPPGDAAYDEEGQSEDAGNGFCKLIEVGGEDSDHGDLYRREAAEGDSTADVVA